MASPDGSIHFRCGTKGRGANRGIARASNARGAQRDSGSPRESRPAVCAWRTIRNSEGGLRGRDAESARGLIAFCAHPPILGTCMNAPKPRSEIAAMSAEALVGLGITIAALGLLGLLLGWAQHMRSVPGSAMLWLGVGGGGVVLGLIIAATARGEKRG